MTKTSAYSISWSSCPSSCEVIPENSIIGEITEQVNLQPAESLTLEVKLPLEPSQIQKENLPKEFELRKKTLSNEKSDK